MLWALALAMAEPPVQLWSFGARAAVHTAIWAGWLLALQYVIVAAVWVMDRAGLIQRGSARKPTVSWVSMLSMDVVGYVGWAWPVGLFAAWLNPGAPGGWQWSYDVPNLLLVQYFSLATLMAFDCYSFFAHRWLHVNKAAFVWLHAKHHESKAALDARSTGWMSVEDGLVSDALPILCMYALGALTGCWWLGYAALHNAYFIAIIGHCGYDMSFRNPWMLPLLLLNPMALGYVGIPVHNVPKTHADHHTYPRHNYAFFFGYWDTWAGTAYEPTGPPSTVLFLAAHAVFQAATLVAAWLLCTHFTAFVATWLLAYMLVGPRAAAAAADAVRLPEVTRRLFGWCMDALRRDSHITYAAPGQPGAFQPADATAAAASAHTPQAAAAAAAADDDAQQPVQQPGKPPVYLFACHPTGLISRAALQTFGARGWASPVSALPKVRLAVASLLLRVPVPFMREVLLAVGCMPGDRACIKAALQCGTSVALTVGGWAESRYITTYKLVLHRRRGFVALAAETGAHLVPVLCLGEQDVVGPPEPCYMFFKWLLSSPPQPVHVVFGKPIAPQADESVSQLHGRYVEALLALGKEHGVSLEIVE